MGSLVNRTSYTNPNVNVDTSGPGGAGVGGLEVDPFFMNMAKRRMALEAQRAAMGNSAMAFDLKKKLQDKSFDDRTPGAPTQEQAEQQQYQHELRDADLNANGQNLKMRQGFNIEGGYATDTENLPLSMRPKSASFQGDMGPSPAGINPKSLGTGRYDPAATEMRARADLAGPGGGEFNAGLLGMTAEEEQKKRLLKAEAQAQARYFSGRG